MGIRGRKGILMIEEAMEYWSTGVLGCVFVLYHYSITPPLHYSKAVRDGCYHER